MTSHVQHESQDFHKHMGWAVAESAGAVAKSTGQVCGTSWKLPAEEALPPSQDPGLAKEMRQGLLCHLGEWQLPHSKGSFHDHCGSKLSSPQKSKVSCETEPGVLDRDFLLVGMKAFSNPGQVTDQKENGHVCVCAQTPLCVHTLRTINRQTTTAPEL